MKPAKQIKRSADHLTVFDQRDFTFTAHSPYETHCHPAVDGIQELICIYRDSKRAGLIDTSKSAAQVADEVIGKYSAQSLVNKNNLRRAIRNQRNKRKRKESADPRQSEKRLPPVELLISTWVINAWCRDCLLLNWLK